MLRHILVLAVAVCCGHAFFMNQKRSGNDVLCKSCRDVARPEDCTALETCGQDEECFTRSYTDDNGRRAYRLGCEQKAICRLAKTNLFGRRASDGASCFDCCQYNECNKYLCTQTQTTTTGWPWGYSTTQNPWYSTTTWHETPFPWYLYTSTPYWYQSTSTMKPYSTPYWYQYTSTMRPYSTPYWYQYTSTMRPYSTPYWYQYTTTMRPYSTPYWGYSTTQNPWYSATTWHETAFPWYLYTSTPYWYQYTTTMRPYSTPYWYQGTTTMQPF